MIARALEAEILRLHHAEHWPIGTIAAQLRVHHSTVRRVLAQAGVEVTKSTARASIVAPYLAFIVAGSLAVGDGGVTRLTGGADAVIDCVGSPESLADAFAVVRPGGTVVLVGMPGVVKVDLTPLWHREIRLVGAYAYGTEPLAANRRTFSLATELVAELRLGWLVSARYTLDRYQEALAHAGINY